jgi:hypothetical protein
MNKFIKEVFMENNKENFIEKLKKVFSKEKIKEFFANKKRKNVFIAVCSVLAVLLIAFIICLVYVNDYYRADGEAIADFLSQEMTSATFNIDEDGLIIATPAEIKAGFIFYPGGKVEYSSYLPLMVALAERGILCVLTPMPCNLAVLDVNAADGIIERFPEVDTWYIGGHSLGGSMAASYLSKNLDELDGLILLGSYSTADVSSSRVLTISGTEDEVMNKKKYDKYIANLPLGCDEVLITGGNHAYFGMYGEQKGDGTASITPAEQITRAAYRIADFILDR